MNLTDDYQKIQSMALAKKQQDAVKAWVKRKASSTFVRITNEYQTCTFNNKWNNN
jgi:peptidyl-prolyl cis-trans isomerase SurA